MARTEARIHTAIWDDADFVALHSQAQRAYFVILSQRELSLCGHLSYTPARWARFAPDTTPAAARKALAALEAQPGRFVVVDHDTEELVVRTFMRHDGVLTMPNLIKSAARYVDRIHSPTLRQSIHDELPEPLREGWPDFYANAPAKAIGDRLRKASGNPSEEPFLEREAENPSDNPPPEGMRNPRPPIPRPPILKSSNNSSNSAPAHDEDDGLDPRLWALIAERRQARQPPGSIENPQRWLATVAANAQAEHAERARDLHARYDVDLRQLADLLADGGEPPGAWGAYRRPTPQPEPEEAA